MFDAPGQIWQRLKGAIGNVKSKADNDEEGNTRWTVVFDKKYTHPMLKLRTKEFTFKEQFLDSVIATKHFKQ